MAIVVRVATHGDIGWLLPQLKEFAQFFNTKKSLYGTDEYATEFITALISNHVVLIATSEIEGPLGFVAGVVTPHSYNPEIKCLAETFWWVDPKYRGGKAALLLLNAFVAKGKEIKADWLTFSVEERSQLNEKSLTKRGFHLHEKTYLMELSNG